MQKVIEVQEGFDVSWFDKNTLRCDFWVKVDFGEDDAADPNEKIPCIIEYDVSLKTLAFYGEQYILYSKIVEYVKYLNEHNFEVI